MTAGGRWARRALCFLCGALLGTCLWVPPLGPAAFAAAAPALACILRERDRRRSLLLCGAFTLGLCMAGYSMARGLALNVPPAAAFFLTLLFYAAACALHGALLALCLWVGARLPCGRLPRCAALALLWAGGEWLCGAGPLAWTSLRLGLALWRQPALIQAASCLGLLGVSALIMAVNTLLAQTLCRVLDHGRGRLRPLAAAALLLAANVLWGAAALARSDAGDTVTVAAVQPGIASHEGSKSQIYAAAQALTAQAAQQEAALILVPESCTFSTFYYDSAAQAFWTTLARESGGSVLIGGPLAAVRDRLGGETLSPLAPSVSPDELLPDGSRRYARLTRSAAYLLEPDGGTELYTKRREIPFFENGRGGEPFRLLPRAGSQRLDAGALPVGVLICYESMFSSMARQAAREGAALLAVPTNDSWFTGDPAKRLHMAHGVFRAVETGLPLVQAGLDGYTAAVSARGELLAELAPGTAGLLTAELTPGTGRTPYLLWGDGWLALGLAGVFILFVIHRRYTPKTQAFKEDKT